MSGDDPAAIESAVERAIRSGHTVTLVVKLESGSVRRVTGVVTNFYDGRDGKKRVGLLVGVQTQQAVLLESIVEVVTGP